MTQFSAYPLVMTLIGLELPEVAPVLVGNGRKMGYEGPTRGFMSNAIERACAVALEPRKEFDAIYSGGPTNVVVGKRRLTTTRPWLAFNCQKPISEGTPDGVYTQIDIQSANTPALFSTIVQQEDDGARIATMMLFDGRRKLQISEPEAEWPWLQQQAHVDETLKAIRSLDRDALVDPLAIPGLHLLHTAMYLSVHM